MNTRQKTKWWVDAALFAAFIVAFFLDLSGIALHQWIGVIAGTLALVHMLSHWNWIGAVSRRLWSDKTSGRARLFYLLDAAIFGGFLLMIGTGLAISTWLDLSLTNYNAWRFLHIVISIVTLLLTTLKLGLHWRWIAMTSRNTLARQSIPAPRMAGNNQVSRRVFLETMGILSAASLLALVSASTSLNASQGVQAATSQRSAPEATSASNSIQASSAASSTCSVRCPRGCSYPGSCRRYTDSNNNNLCDFGECL